MNMKLALGAAVVATLMLAGCAKQETAPAPAADSAAPAADSAAPAADSAAPAADSAASAPASSAP